VSVLFLVPAHSVYFGQRAVKWLLLIVDILKILYVIMPVYLSIVVILMFGCVLQ